MISAEDSIIQKSHGNSGAEDQFIKLFCETFGAEKEMHLPGPCLYSGKRHHYKR